MRRGTFFFLSVLFVTLLAASVAIAASTTAGVGISRGQNDSMAYSLNIKQRYDSWISNDAFELAPLAEIGGHAWVARRDSANDRLYGGFLAPGLRFTLYTGKNFQPYLEATVGGALNNENKFDKRELGSYLLLRTRGSVGVAFGEEARHRIQGDYTNHSTGGITKKNDGYNTFGLSYGYSF